mmetsp:Transcript_17978/g.34273  ORF Transcript_17978/g.34273 Transcript_17978/m.34273 type:complete len:99 (+) Transcript_17978:1412-1708(+)
MRPLSITAIRSAFRIVESLCATTTHVCSVPNMILSKASWTIFSECESSADVASSSSSTTGRFMRARAIAILCFCPPDTNVLPCPTRVWYPSGKVEIKS